MLGGLEACFVMTACAAAPPPTTSPPPSILAPVNKAKDVAGKVQQKGLELDCIGADLSNFSRRNRRLFLKTGLQNPCGDRQIAGRGYFQVGFFPRNNFNG